MPIRSALQLALLFIFAISVDARVWKDKEGHPMTAEFVKTYDRSGETMAVFTKDGMRVQVPLERLSEEDQKHIADILANGGVDSSKSSANANVEKTEFEKAILKNLVQRDGNRLKRVKSDDLAPKEYYAIYYSAHWCPPCRGFTPKLVDFYNKASAEHDNFEIIFVSNDRDEDAMEGYVTEYGMNWLSLDFDKKKSSDELTKFSGNGIPCLVLVDRNGNVLKDSYEGRKYMGPTRVMNELDRLLSKKQG